VPAESYRRQLGVAWVRDVGYACALACDLRRPLGGAYNVAFEGVSLEDLMRGIGRAFGRDPELVPVPWSELPVGASPYGPDPTWPAGYDLARARRELGFEPSGLEDALADTLHWYLARRPSHPGYQDRAEELRIAARLQPS
jgi:nucleoside-diphosphate-sugar epimerase